MANWGYLLGGAVVGAAGLYTAVNELSKKDEVRYPLRSYTAPLCSVAAETADRLSASEVVQHLSEYKNASTRLHMKCSLICADSIAYQDAPYSTPVDGIWDRLKHSVCGYMTETGRPWMLESLVKVRKNLARLYLSYHPVFLRANALLKEGGIQTVSLKGLTLKNVTLEMSHALSNETWGQDFEKQADKLRDFIDRTVGAATALRERLKIRQNPEYVASTANSSTMGA